MEGTITTGIVSVLIGAMGADGLHPIKNKRRIIIDLFMMFQIELLTDYLFKSLVKRIGELYKVNRLIRITKLNLMNFQMV